jgi:hypothetical protein
LLVDFDGCGLVRAYAETRAGLEPIYEATQIKGDGETHPFLSPNDEFAGFERWDKGNLDLTELKRPEMLQYEYARSGLELGLKLEQELGVNPFKFGMIGSTDSHTSLATADQDNFFGKHSGAEPICPGCNWRRHQAPSFFVGRASGYTEPGPWSELFTLNCATQAATRRPSRQTKDARSLITSLREKRRSCVVSL